MLVAWLRPGLLLARDRCDITRGYVVGRAVLHERRDDGCAAAGLFLGDVAEPARRRPLVDVKRATFLLVLLHRVREHACLGQARVLLLYAGDVLVHDRER